MPINGLSETRRITRLGKIRIGLKKTNAKGIPYPAAVDYFILPDEAAKVYPGQPKKLDIMFPLDQPEAIAPQYLKCYSSYRGLVCKGTGTDHRTNIIGTCRRLVDTKTGDYVSRTTPQEVGAAEWKEGLPCDQSICPKYLKGDCKEVMCLQFMLPRVPGIGVYQLDTSSKNSIIQINSAIDLLKSMAAKMNGTIKFVPLELVIGPKDVLTPEGIKKTIQTLDIHFMGSYEQLEAASGQTAGLEMPEPDEETPPEELFPTDEGKAAAKEAEAHRTLPAAPVKPMPKEEADSFFEDAGNRKMTKRAQDAKPAEQTAPVVSTPAPADQAAPFGGKAQQAAPAGASKDMAGNIPLSWLYDVMAVLRWRVVTLISYINSNREKLGLTSQVAGKTASEAVGQLNQEQAGKFIAAINEMVKLKG